MEGLEYKRKKLEYKSLCERKRREKSERWEKKALEAKKEREVINKDKRRMKLVNEVIEEEEWRDCFMRSLGGAEAKVMLGEREEGIGRGKKKD